MDNFETLKKWLQNDDIKLRFKKALQQHMSVDAWIETALLAVKNTDKVVDANPKSTLGALMTVASLGLRLDGPLGQAYLESRSVKKYNSMTRQWEYNGYETQMQVGYRGLLDLIYRNPEVRDVEILTVYQNDNVEFRRGSEPYFHQKWDHTAPKEARGDVSMYICGLRYKDGYYSWKDFPIEDVLEHKDKVLLDKNIRVERNAEGKERFFGKKKNGSEYEIDPKTTMNPWIKHPVPMLQKTCVKWSSKFWDLSPDVKMAVGLTDMEESGVSQSLEGIGAAAIKTEEKPVNNAQEATLQRNDELTEMMASEALKNENAE